jgi:hypothetical protein
MLKKLVRNRFIGVFLIAVLPLFASASAWGYESQLRLALPGQSILKEGENTKAASTGWYALSLQDGALVLESTNRLASSTSFSATGVNADKLFNGQALNFANKSSGLALQSPSESLLFARIDDESGRPKKLKEGRFSSAVRADVLREGWSASGEIGAGKWHFFTDHKKRADGKMLSGSLELMAQKAQANGSAGTKKSLLAKAFGMAFAKQELLWLGDLNQDGEPDLLVRRTWITGEVDYVLVVTPWSAGVYLDPDYPASYFLSGVEPEGNVFTWYKNTMISPQIGFASLGSFKLSEEAWKQKLTEADLALPKLLTDRVLKLNGETVRVTLEHLPRIERADSQDPAERETGSQSAENRWDGSVLLRVTFRGKSQVLMQLQAPDGEDFSFSVGVVDGKPSIRVDYHPHYNNSFKRYWIYNETEMRFRRVLTDQSQGC